MTDIKTEDIENLNPLTDTGKVLKQLLLDRLEEREKLDEILRRVRERDERSSQVWKALKQSVLQFLALIGRK